MTTILGPDVIRVSVTIAEREVTGGWILRWPGVEDEAFQTAVEALNGALRNAKGLPHSSIMEITWEPCTPIGRSVVKVVTS